MSFYCDYMASPPMCEEAIKAYGEAARSFIGNPNGINDLSVQASMEIARLDSRFLCLLGLKGKVKWFGTATEATKSLFDIVSRKDKITFLVSGANHKCVFEALNSISSRKNVQFGILKVDLNGKLVQDNLKALVELETTRGRRCIVSIIHINNELGTLDQIHEIAEIVHLAGGEVHLDASQSLGKLDYRQRASLSKMDFITFSSRKFYGPHAGGTIYNDTISDWHTGTPSLPNISGSVAALQYCSNHFNPSMYEKTSILRRRFLNIVKGHFPKLYVNSIEGVPWCVNIQIPDIRHHVKMDEILVCNDVAFSTGSACTTGLSSVLKACGYARSHIESSCRISFDPISADDRFIIDVAEKFSHSVLEYLNG